MTLADDVTLDDLIMAKDDLSGAGIKAICTEAGLMALREHRMKVANEDFKKSKETVLYKKQEGTPEGLYLEQPHLPSRKWSGVSRLFRGMRLGKLSRGTHVPVDLS
ncbi:26s protease regulatory subunit 4 [Lynx pardinus]|uniref:26s protease regulatory subunit 4 n=1 Tax=Lynx pardinus TaxID=191816 RepID=A0A485PK60_LYNPA|nr:26s protease regulatory subunit 4 [Lynx pardinus]